MDRVKNALNIGILGWVTIPLLLLTSACVYDKEFSYLNDQIVSLNKRVGELQKSVDRGLKTDYKADMQSISSDLKSDMQSMSSNQTELRLEIDQLRDYIQELSGRVEENEHILKQTVEKDLNERDAIKSELNDLPQLTQRIEELEKTIQFQQAYLNLDSRAEQKPGYPAAPGSSKKPGEGLNSSELSLYETSLDLFRQEKIDQSMEGFKRFLSEFPNSDRADNAQFWIGECLMAQKQYKKAILAYEDVIKNYPTGNKVPNAMLRQAIAFQKIDDNTMSRLLFEKVVKEFPNSSEAEIAKAELKKIK